MKTTPKEGHSFIQQVQQLRTPIVAILLSHGLFFVAGCRMTDLELRIKEAELTAESTNNLPVMRTSLPFVP